ncbi:MAG TPA: PHB depolymerase family esterase [Kofleriaceae bacterium]|nr:PHB depolymerase family esterase [Kofleriaceae bacterium]
MRRSLAVAFVGLVAGVIAPGCGDHLGGGGAVDGTPAGTDAGPGADGPPAIDAGRDPVLDARPYELYVPPSYQAGTPTPLVLMLHGYSANADLQEVYFQLQPEAEAKGFLYARANGTVDPLGNRFWNATDACCNLGHSAVDDVAYLRAVLDDIEARYTVDPKRVFVIGHSNGAFMAHRLACDLSGRIAAIVTFAGDVWADATKCNPTQPVSVLQIHGTFDAVIAYNGGQQIGMDGPYPAAPTTVAIWRAKNGCTGTMQGGRFDLTSDLPGDESQLVEGTGCPAGGAVELMTVNGGGHVPVLKQPEFRDTVWDFFAAHPRP